MIVPSTLSPRAKAALAVVIIAAVFLALRLPGIHLPYHQDEWKNVAASATVSGAGNFFAHPPLMQMLFVGAYAVLGTDYMRLFPLLFSAASAVLLYFVVRDRSNRRSAVLSVSLFAICFYNILGSLQPDVDGAILPFFFLLALFAYDKLRRPDIQNRGLWSALFILASLSGLLVKLNFILAIAAIILDYLWSIRKQAFFRKAAVSLLSFAAFVLVYIGLLYLIQRIYPAFSVSLMLDHASQYSGGRNWTQIIVQGVKAIYYLSPLLLVPLLFVSRAVLKKTLPFCLYLAVGFIFYFVLFDFSKAALDKYLLFAVVPLAAIVGNILDGLFTREASRRIKWAVVIGLAVALVIVLLNFLPQSVVALYPKDLWFSRVLHGHWNILTPFNGGSGPLGFYVSFLFIASSFIMSILVALVAVFKKSWRVPAVVIVAIIGLSYNAVFAEELMSGRINGSAPQVLADAVAYIGRNDAIKQVLTYNDTGNGPLTLVGKYAGRIYATPEAEDGYKQKFAAFDGQYLVVDIPRFDPAGFYYRFFAQCRVLFESDSANITAKVYDCPHDQKTMDSL